MSDQSTLYFGNLDGRVTEKVLYDICVQAGPVSSIKLKTGFGFVEYEDVESAQYALELFRGTLLLYSRNVRVDLAKRA